MNILIIDKKFKKLNLIEDYINYKFEPKSQNLKGISSRHIYYNDLKFDFIDEINTYGFSPFIQESYDIQRKNKNIMMHKNTRLNQGLWNYVKKANKKYKVLDNCDEINNNKNKIITDNQIITDKDYRKNRNRKEDFLKNALEKLARNKLNISEDFDIFSNENEDKDGNIIDTKSHSQMKDKNEVSLTTNKMKKYLQINMNANANKKIIKTSSNLSKSKFLNNKVNFNPIITVSNVNKPEPILNLGHFIENVFMGMKNLNPKDINSKKTGILGLFKNKANLSNIIKEINEEKIFQNENIKELDRNNVYPKPSTPITNESKLKNSNIFKKLFNQSKFLKKFTKSESPNKNAELAIKKELEIIEKEKEMRKSLDDSFSSTTNNKNRVKSNNPLPDNKKINIGKVYVESMKNLNKIKNPIYKGEADKFHEPKIQIENLSLIMNSKMKNNIKSTKNKIY